MVVTQKLPVMVNRLLILGASGHGKVAANCAYTSGKWSSLVFFDDRWPELISCGMWSVAGRGDDLFKIAQPDDQVFVAIGNSTTRLDWLHQFQNFGLTIATIIHPSAIVSQGVSIGVGSLIVAGGVVNVGCKIGCGCIVNTGATVDHDCVLEDGVHVCPGVNLAGEVHVGRKSWIGIGSSVIQCIRIGSGVTIGAGAVVLNHVEDGLTVVGVPARPIIRKD
ncbi:PglD_N domain-containing protein [Gammaproteobacteria bacterium]